MEDERFGKEMIMNKSTKQGIIIGAAIIATVGLSSTVQADETSASQPQAKTPMTVSNEDKIAETTKETVDMAKANADETAKTVTEQEQVVSEINQKVKEAETTYKVAQVELTRAKEFDAERQVKIDERKSALDKLKTEKDISALEQSLEDAKAKVDSKAKVLEEMKDKLDAAQSEIENAKKALTDAQATYDLVFKKFKQDRKLRQIVIPKDYAQHDINDIEWFKANTNKFLDAQPKNNASDGGFRFCRIEA